MQVSEARFVHLFFQNRLGLHWSQDFRGAVYVPDEFRGRTASMDHVAVAVGFNGFIGRTCCIHIVIQRPELFSRRIIREIFEYGFLHAGCEVLLALIDSTNAPSRELVQRVGFELCATVPHGGLEDDLEIWQMTRGACRWLKPH